MATYNLQVTRKYYLCLGICFLGNFFHHEHTLHKTANLFAKTNY